MAVARVKFSVAIAVGLLTLACAAGGKAQTASRPAEVKISSASEAYAALVSTDWGRRDAAQRFLMTMPAEERENVEKALFKTNDPEAEARLTAVAVHLYLKGETSLVGESGLLGITLSQETLAQESDGRILAAIAITDLQPGFPAAEVLQAGDRIIALNDIPFSTDTTIASFRETVMRVKAGTSIKLTIKRGAEVRDVMVKLAAAPEGGTAALMEFIQQRTEKIEAYRARLREMKAGHSMLPPSGGEPINIGEMVIPETVGPIRFKY